MKRIFITALAVAMIGGSAYAASDFVDTAQVISSKPRIERVTESHQECDPVPAQQKSGSGSIVAPIIGGVAGGLLGHQVGQGSGKTAATIIGATGGAVAGSVIADRSSANSQPPQQCRTVETSREVVNGYEVVYRYNGRDGRTTLPYDPGAGGTIKVGVSAVAEERPVDSGRRDEDDKGRRGRDRSDGRRNGPGNGGDNYNGGQYRY